MVHHISDDPPTAEFLSKDELRDLTGKARSGDQARWLVAQGVAHRVDGRRVIVSRFHVRKWLEGKHVPQGTGIRWNVPGMIGYDPSKPPEWDPSKRSR